MRINNRIISMILILTGIIIVLLPNLHTNTQVRGLPVYINPLYHIGPNDISTSQPENFNVAIEGKAEAFRGWVDRDQATLTAFSPVSLDYTESDSFWMWEYRIHDIWGIDLISSPRQIHRNQLIVPNQEDIIRRGLLRESNERQTIPNDIELVLSPESELLTVLDITPEPGTRKDYPIKIIASKEPIQSLVPPMAIRSNYQLVIRAYVWYEGNEPVLFAQWKLGSTLLINIELLPSQPSGPTIRLWAEIITIGAKYTYIGQVMRVICPEY